jgi:predicted DNA-binding transcriptional regulator AlpA
MTKSPSEKLIPVSEVADWLGVSRSTIYKWVELEKFPPPLILGIEGDGKRSASRWYKSEVTAWLEDRPRGIQHGL